MLSLCERCLVNYKETDHPNSRYCIVCKKELKSILNKRWRVMNFDYNAKALVNWRKHITQLEKDIKSSNAQKHALNPFSFQTYPTKDISLIGNEA